MLIELMATMRELSNDPVLLFTMVLVTAVVAGSIALILRNLGKAGLLVIVVILLAALVIRRLM